jgi:hypothetical protein
MHFGKELELKHKSENRLKKKIGKNPQAPSPLGPGVACFSPSSSPPPRGPAWRGLLPPLLLSLGLASWRGPVCPRAVRLGGQAASSAFPARGARGGYAAATAWWWAPIVIPHPQKPPPCSPLPPDVRSLSPTSPRRPRRPSTLSTFALPVVSLVLLSFPLPHPLLSRLGGSFLRDAPARPPPFPAGTAVVRHAAMAWLRRGSRRVLPHPEPLSLPHARPSAWHVRCLGAACPARGAPGAVRQARGMARSGSPARPWCSCPQPGTTAPYCSGLHVAPPAHLRRTARPWRSASARHARLRRLGPGAAQSAPDAALAACAWRPRRGSFAAHVARPALGVPSPGQCGLARARACAVYAASSTGVVPVMNIIIDLT